MSGVIIALSGASRASLTTDTYGSYAFAVEAGSYTVTPTLAGHTFSPSNIAVTVSDADVAGVDFTSAVAITFHLTGRVTGAITSGVAIVLTGAGSAAMATDLSGAYDFVVPDGSYKVTPSAFEYAFTPASRSVTVSGASVSGVDFVGAVSTIGDRTNYGAVTLTSGGTYSSGSPGVERLCTSYSSTTSDTPAVKVAPGGSLTLTNSQVVKNAGAASSPEDAGSTGLNSGVLVSSSSSATSYESSSASSVQMTDCTITTGVAGASGVFAFGAGAAATLDHVTIRADGDRDSRGVGATYGGRIVLTDSVVSTSGADSPGLYTAGALDASGCTVTATGSEAARLDGKNTVALYGTRLAAGLKWGVLFFRDPSSGSSAGTGEFFMSKGELANTFANGPLFFVCNTTAIIALENVRLVNAADILLVAGEALAASGAIDHVDSRWAGLGGTVTLKAIDQTMTGDIIVCDSSSSIDLMLTRSILEGAIDGDDRGPGDKLKLDASSKWTADGDSYVETLDGLVFSGRVPLNVDARAGVTIYYSTGWDATGSAFSGTYALAGGGTLKKR